RSRRGRRTRSAWRPRTRRPPGRRPSPTERGSRPRGTGRRAGEASTGRDTPDPPRTAPAGGATGFAPARCVKRARNLAAALGAVKTHAPLAGGARRGHDLPERRRLERGAAHERAVHVGLGEERRRVPGVDAATVEDRGLLPRARPEDAVERRAHHAVSVAGLLGRRHLAGADRPYRLVGDRGRAGRGGGEAVIGDGDLAHQHRLRVTLLALGERLADANDGCQ